MLNTKKVATDRRNAFMLGARHYINTKVAAGDRKDAVRVIKAAFDAAGDIHHRLHRGNSREVLQLKVALESQGIHV